MTWSSSQVNQRKSRKREGEESKTRRGRRDESSKEKWNKVYRGLISVLSLIQLIISYEIYIIFSLPLKWYPENLYTLYTSEELYLYLGKPSKKKNRIFYDIESKGG